MTHKEAMLKIVKMNEEELYELLQDTVCNYPLEYIEGFEYALHSSKPYIEMDGQIRMVKSYKETQEGLIEYINDRDEEDSELSYPMFKHSISGEVLLISMIAHIIADLDEEKVMALSWGKSYKSDGEDPRSVVIEQFKSFILANKNINDGLRLWIEMQ